MIDDLPEQDTPDTAPEPAPIPSDEPTGDPELSALLRQYDEQASASPVEPEEPHPFADEEADEIERILAQYPPDDPDPEQPVPQQVGMSDLDLLRAWAHGIDQERAAAREQADVAHVMSMANEHVADLEGVPPGFGEMALRAEYSRDPELLNAWNNRYENAASLRRAEKVVSRKLKKIRADAKRLPDPQATADRALVTQAVRAASNGAPPPKAPPAYSRMSDSEFATQVEKEFGFRPLS